MQVFISVCRLHSLVLSTFILEKHFLLGICAPRGTVVLVRFFPEKSRKNTFVVAYLMLSTRIPTLFTMSLIHTAGFKMAAHTVVFLRLPNVGF